MEFAEFVDRVTFAYARSATYRRRLLRESPHYRGRGGRTACPPEHPHAASSHCYSAHRCGCRDCLTASNVRQAAVRRRRAENKWKTTNTRSKTK